MRTGGQVLVGQLAMHSIRRVFTVPGESFLGVLDALHDSPIQAITCRHEGGATFMAEAHARLTGCPGIAFVTRGPGATNASCGVHAAMHNSTPMILFAGQVPRQHRGRVAFQEIDLPAMFAPLCKWADDITNAERIPEFVGRAMQIALSGRPGPVFLSLPEDMLLEQTNVQLLDAVHASTPIIPESSLDDVTDLLMEAKRPLAVLGGSIWSNDAAKMIETISGRLDIPVVTSFRRQDYIDNRFANYAGDLSVGVNPALKDIVGKSDCLLLLGTRMGDIPTSGYTAITASQARSSIIHVHPDPEESGRIWPYRKSVVATPESFLAAMLSRNDHVKTGRASWLDRCRKAHEAWLVPNDLPGSLQMSAVMAWLSENNDDETIITHGAGNYAAFLHRYYRFRQPFTQLGSTSGSMGYGLPAAIAAALEHPDRMIICLAGDGCFQMTMNEMSTVKQWGLQIIIIIANNGIYGTIRMHQETHYPYRVSGTDLENPCYMSLARSYDFHAEQVTHTDDFPAAFQRAASSRKSALIELVLDPEAISTSRSIGDIRARASS